MTRVLVAVLIVLLLLLLIAHNQSAFVQAWWQGAWEGDRQFCEDAGIGGMLLYVGPWCAKHQGWRSFLIMFSEETILHAQILYLQLGSVLAAGSFLGQVGPLATSLTIQPAELYVENTLPVEDLMPLQLSCALDPVKGTQEWLDSETSYARFCKTA